MCKIRRTSLIVKFPQFVSNLQLFVYDHHGNVYGDPWPLYLSHLQLFTCHLPFSFSHFLFCCNTEFYRPYRSTLRDLSYESQNYLPSFQMHFGAILLLYVCIYIHEHQISSRRGRVLLKGKCVWEQMRAHCGKHTKWKYDFFICLHSD